MLEQKIKCSCRCHDENSRVMHIMPCCDNGFITVKPKLKPFIIAVNGIKDRHTNKQPEILQFDTIEELYSTLIKMLPTMAHKPTQDECMELIKTTGFIRLLKKEFQPGKYIYQY